MPSEIQTTILEFGLYPNPTPCPTERHVAVYDAPESRKLQVSKETAFLRRVVQMESAGI